MDGILVLVLIGWLIKFASSKNKKKQGNNQKTAKRTVRFPTEAQFNPTVVHNPEPAVSEYTPQEFAPAEGEGYQASWIGSMNVDSDEGEDLCDPSLGHERETIIDPQSVYAGEIGKEPLLDLSSRGLMQGVIMSEILTRPAQRKYR